MSDPMQGMVIFADDVRDEVGGKTSIMGILGSEIDVRGIDTIRQLTVVLLLWAPEGEFKVRGEIKIANAPQDYESPPELNAAIPNDRGDGLSMVQIVARLLPMKLEGQPVTITVKFDVGDSSFRGSLVINHKQVEADNS